MTNIPLISNVFGVCLYKSIFKGNLNIPFKSKTIHFKKKWKVSDTCQLIPTIYDINNIHEKKRGEIISDKERGVNSAQKIG